MRSREHLTALRTDPLDHLTRPLCLWQAKISRLRTLPEKIASRTEVEFCKLYLVYEKRSDGGEFLSLVNVDDPDPVMLSPEMKTLWGKVDRSKLGKSSIYAPLPKRPCGKVSQDAFDEQMIIRYNNKETPKGWLAVGKNYNTTICPSLSELKEQVVQVLRAPLSPTQTLLPRLTPLPVPVDPEVQHYHEALVERVAELTRQSKANEKSVEASSRERQALEQAHVAAAQDEASEVWRPREGINQDDVDMSDAESKTPSGSEDEEEEPQPADGGCGDSEAATLDDLLRASATLDSLCQTPSDTETEDEDEDEDVDTLASLKLPEVFLPSRCNDKTDDVIASPDAKIASKIGPKPPTGGTRDTEYVEEDGDDDKDDEDDEEDENDYKPTKADEQQEDEDDEDDEDEEYVQSSEDEQLKSRFTRRSGARAAVVPKLLNGDPITDKNHYELKGCPH